MKAFLKTCAVFFVGVSFWGLAFSLVSRFDFSHGPTIKSVQAKSPIAEVSPAPQICFPTARISTFMYHYVRDPIKQDAKIIVQLSVPPKVFAAQMEHVRALADAGKVAILSTDELLKAVHTKCYPNPEIFVFTDDDGWIDAYTELAPIARKYQIPFTFAIITSKFTTDGFVTENEVRVLSQDPLFTIASHSVSHVDLDVATEEAEHREMCDSKQTLEAITHKPVSTFVFPAGRISTHSSKTLKDCGYSLAYSTSMGKPWPESKEHLDINRIRVYPESTPEYFDKFLK